MGISCLHQRQSLVPEWENGQAGMPYSAVKYAVIIFSAAFVAASEPGKPIEPRLPKLNSVFPQGAQPGAQLRVEVLGEFIDRAQTVVFLDPAIHGSVVASTYTRLALDLTVTPDVPLGPHYFRVVTPRGASNILLFRVGDLPHILEKEPNSTFEQAQEVTIPVTINGRLDIDGDFDFYRFRVEKGQSWIFDLRSARNGNSLDPALILLDSHGRKLAHSEDVFIWDPFIYHTFPEAGAYYAVVQPTHTHNDPSFAYQLDIRTAPHLETISPISMRPGATLEATIFGVGLTGSGKLWFESPGFSGEALEMRGGTARVKIHCPADAPEGPTQLAIATPGGRSNPATFLIDSTPVHPGGDRILPPVSVTGIARYRQPERFAFDVKAGEQLVFEVRAQRFGSPVDSQVRVVDTLGNQVAANDDYDFPGSHYSKDSYLSHEFKEAGRYFVEIRNLWKTTGEDFPYQLLVHPPRPGFEPQLLVDSRYLYAGEPAWLTVKLLRHDGFKDPVRVEVKGLPPGVTAEPLQIPSDKDQGDIAFHVSAGAKPGTYGNIQVLASGASRPAWSSVQISSGGGEGETFATVDQATLAVIEKPRFSLEAAVETVHVVRGGTAEFQVAIARAEGFSEPLQFSFENLPPGVRAREPGAPADATSVTIQLTAAKDAQPGRFSRVAILGQAVGGQVQQAPHITIVLD
jgi:hypothetical protein